MVEIDRRWQVASRAFAAIVGGYVAANATAAAFARLLPMPRADAVLTGVLCSFLFYVTAVVWVFSTRSAGRAWLGILAVIAVCGGIALLGGWVAS